MAQYMINAPTGEQYQITAPDNASQADVLSYAQQNHIANSNNQTPDLNETGALPKSVSIGPQSSGFVNNVAQNMRERGANLADIVGATRNNQQTVPEEAFQGIGNEVGALGDITGQGISSAAKSLPESIKIPVVEGIKNLANTEIGRQGLQALHSGIDTWNQFKNNNPRAARNIEALVNIGTFVGPEIKGMTLAGATGDLGAVAVKGATKGLETTGEIIGNIADKIKPDELLNSDQLKDLSRYSYTTAKQAGGIVKSEVADKFYNTIDQLGQQTEHGIATTGEDELAQLIQRWAPLKNKPISLDAAQEMDQGLNQIIDKYVDKSTGKLTQEGQKIYNVQNKFRDMIENTTADDLIGGKQGFDAYKQARSLWSMALRVGDIERILSRAAMTDNSATSIKAGFRTLYNNPSRMRGYSTAEKAAIKQAAQDGIVSNTLRTVLGSRLLSLIVGAKTGGVGGAIASPFVAAGSRAVANNLQTRKATKIIQKLNNRIPMGGLHP